MLTRIRSNVPKRKKEDEEEMQRLRWSIATDIRKLITLEGQYEVETYLKMFFSKPF